RGTADIQAIVEENAASAAHRKLREIHSGFYVFAAKPFFQHIDELSTDSPHREYYLTDMAGILGRTKEKVIAYKTADPNEVLGSNTRSALAQLDTPLRTA